jgi:hypothetical protein
VRFVALIQVRPFRSTNEGHPAVLRVSVEQCVGQAFGPVCGQAMAQPVLVWVRPRVIRRRRFQAATRWCSQWSFLATPR